MNNPTLNHDICDCRHSLEGYATSLTNDYDDANDLVQDTLIKAIRCSHLYKEGTNLKGWLFTIMKNTFINNYRRSVKKKSVVETTDELTSYQLASSAATNLCDRKFTSEDINKAFGKVAPEYAIPFLRYFEGYKYHEIADELGIPLGTVKTRIHVARHILKKQLKIYEVNYYKTA
ncbi:RNA polymerase sigma factor [Pedobacter faecalis]|uniref:RNA polymerase sigma factor n=1 Tax=Pedobacter faecalis TaxID=3041495 RepID=UPI00254C1E2C|nr:RNA polymerase sigma factor [Pedobacter sp. ELA7]